MEALLRNCKSSVSVIFIDLVIDLVAHIESQIWCTCLYLLWWWLNSGIFGQARIECVEKRSKGKKICTQKKSAKITEKISKTLGVDFEKVDFKIIIF